MSALPTIKVTLLSAQDIVLLSNVARRHGYVERGAARLPEWNAFISTKYLLYSPWLSAQPLHEKLHTIRARASLPTQQFIETLEIVGHAHRDEAGKPAGIKMRDDVGHEFALDKKGKLQGVENLEALVAHCSPTASLRLILCDGQDLPRKFLQAVRKVLRAGDGSGRRLWTTNARVSENAFGLGGFVDESLLFEVK